MQTAAFTRRLRPLRERRLRRALTLLELLAASATISVIAAIGLPSYFNSLESAEQVKCAMHWRQFGVAVRLYTADNDGLLPPSHYTGRPDQEVRIWLGPYLFPDLPDNQLFRRTASLICPDERWDFGFNAYLSERPVARYSRPEDTIFGIDLCRGGRWLDSDVLGSKVQDLRQATPKPHSGKVNVLWLDGHVSSEYVSRLTRAQVTRDSPGFSNSDLTTQIGCSSFDR